MPTIDEALASGRSPLGSANKAGTDAISSNQEVEFTRYVRLVLPLDGFVFWVRADLVSESALYNACVFNDVTFAANASIAAPAERRTIQGSLHYQMDNRQDEAETYAANRVVFTSEDMVDELNQENPNVLWVGCFEGRKFAFSARGIFYRQAGLWHYSGFAVFPDMESQLVDAISGFRSAGLVVSNSLPIWLAMNYYVKPPWQMFARPPFALYPSYLVPANLMPPWGAVHVDPPGTEAIALSPHFGRTMTHRQLSMDRVLVTLWGARNDAALDFVDFVSQQSLDPGNGFGIMNQPIVRDEKRTQSELNAIAMKKTVEFVVDYDQVRVNDLARQLIKTVVVDYIFGPL